MSALVITKAGESPRNSDSSLNVLQGELLLVNLLVHEHQFLSLKEHGEALTMKCGQVGHQPQSVKKMFERLKN
ncbi:hypothetical protein EVAR_99107_1 [Eumeta japonica]|uniref:Uncharacterized protein n=1 Tax=Eumeta variegata TaxID=151549 RepID=A0A4C1Z1E7_EUMVA|nr:hypothetical protein EVAR_99107_1 [Eumeta japonica]